MQEGSGGGNTNPFGEDINAVMSTDTANPFAAPPLPTSTLSQSIPVPAPSFSAAPAPAPPAHHHPPSVSAPPPPPSPAKVSVASQMMPPPPPDAYTTIETHHDHHHDNGNISDAPLYTASVRSDGVEVDMHDSNNNSGTIENDSRGGGGGSQVTGGGLFAEIVSSTKTILFTSRLNCLLCFIPICFIARGAGAGDGAIFALAVLAIIPLAERLGSYPNP